MSVQQLMLQLQGDHQQIQTCLATSTIALIAG